MPKQDVESCLLPDIKSPLGETPAKLAKREIVKPHHWCPKLDIAFDTWCDPDNPKTINYKDVVKASTIISQEIPKTPLVRSKYCEQFGLELYYKFEIFHKTGSFHERGALYSLTMLTDEQRQDRVYSASTGNWAMALAYYGQKLKIAITVVLPLSTNKVILENCKCFGAFAILFGKNLIEAKKKAFTMISESGRGTYINGYDHPHVIAASGSIGLEILDELPNIDAIIVPIGGGGLIAGISTAIKQLKPEVLVYGVETDKCCCFFKALENERPYQTEVGQCLAHSLAAPTAGYNAFHTARSLIDKMILVDTDWVARGILHLVEEERFVAEGAGAISLGALLAVPDILPELHNKNVVCVISGGNIETLMLPIALKRAKVVEGRIIKMTFTLPIQDTTKRLSIMSIIGNVGCSIRRSDTDKTCISENDLHTIHVNLTIETRDLEHSCTLKRVMERLFPGVCEFMEEPFSPIPICSCFPKRLP